MPEPFVIAHLTDPHLPLGRPGLPQVFSKRGLSYSNWLRSRRYLHRPEIAERVVADIKAAGCDFIAMTGDLVNFSLEVEFAEGAKWLAALGPPDRVGVIPGNHEAMVGGFEARLMRHWQAYVSGDDGRPGFPWLRRRNGVALIGLSSAIATPPILASGRVGEEQCAALGQILAETGREGLCRIVLVHHPPTPITVWRKSLRDRDALCRVIAAEGAELVLHGHTHCADLSWLEGPSGRIPVLGAPACGMRPGIGRDDGGWRRLEISRQDEGWRLLLRERRAAPEGGMVEGASLSFLLPGPVRSAGADVARSVSAS